MESDGEPIPGNRISGAVYGPAIQASSIQGGVHFHLDGGEVGRSAPPSAPERWADVPTLPSDVRSLLKAQVQTAQELPYRMPGARRPALAAVYVRQDLGSGPEESGSEQPRPTPMLDDRGQLVDAPSRPAVRLAVRPPSRTVQAALDGDDHLLVTGGPGQGKSTLSLRLAADVAQRWLSPDTAGTPITEPVVPLRLTARELAIHLGQPFPEAVADSAGIEYGGFLGAPIDARTLRKRIAGCRWLLLVDGLDEVADTCERDRLVAVLAAWASDAGSPYRIVLTTRPIEGAGLAPLQRVGAARYELQPFDEAALRSFADHWFDDTDQAYRFVRQIRAAYLDELVRVPLLATIAAIIFEQRGDHPLPDNQYELYESYLKYLRTAHPASLSPFDQAYGPLVEHLGRVRLEVDASLVAAAQEWARQHIAELPESWQEELTGYLAAVGPFTRWGDDLRFLHHSFAEHLAATAKARLLPEQFEPEHDAFCRLLHAARPEERGRHARAVLVHYTRLHASEADRLIGWLHAGTAEQHVLAARLLAWHVPAGVEVVDAFLATVRAWAMTTQYPGRDILAEASRATYQPGIALWLAGLMADEEAPWQSRIEAATALSTRLRGTETPDAVAQLRRVVDDTDLPVRHRLAAAEALADSGGDQREAAERALRSVLADPSATALTSRNAALVLAGFGDAARSRAAEALTMMLDDPWTPDKDLVEAATGLVEIGVEFHERCADIFRAVLRCRTSSFAGLDDAALSLASLGSHHVAEAAHALTTQILDRRLGVHRRAYAAETLAKLGPQHRTASGDHLLAMSVEFDEFPERRWTIAKSLKNVGLRDQALDLLRVLLSDRAAGTNSQLWAAQTLADLGPEYHEEAARALRRVAEHPMASAYDRSFAFGQLANLGEPHRTIAVAALRDMAADSHADPDFQFRAASEMAGLGPEFHSEVAQHLLVAASHQTDPWSRARAWRTLRNLGTRYHDRASAALLALIGPDEDASWQFRRGRLVPTAAEVDDHDGLADALGSVLRDPASDGETRLDAVHRLVGLGRRFHPGALDWIIELLRSHVVPVDELASIGWRFAEVGSGARTELAAALRAAARRTGSTAAVCHLAEALDDLDYRADPEVIADLRAIVADDLADVDVRGDAAVALARAVPADLTRMAKVLRQNGQSAYSWRRRVLKLAALGADVISDLRSVLADVDSDCRQVEVAAATIAQLRPELLVEVLPALRALARDEFLEFTLRTDAVSSLVTVDPDARDDAIAFHLRVMDDERQPIGDRCEAAHQLAQLDGSHGQIAMAALRRFATSPEFTAADHGLAVVWFAKLRTDRTREVDHLGLAVVRDPTAPMWIRSWVRGWLSGQARLETVRSLLADRTASPEQRVGDVTVWGHPKLAAEAEHVLRDVVAAAETRPAMRVQSAATLASLSPLHVPEAVTLLEELASGGPASEYARSVLADLSPAYRHQMLVEAERAAVDGTSPLRQRCEAASVVCGLVSNPSQHIVDCLRQLVRDPRVADADRVEMLYALRQVDGLDQLRKFRDDERMPPATRWAAAKRLGQHTVADRTVGARVLDTLATDTTCRPTLRWRAADDLMKFGERGRELGAAALRAIMTEESLPVIVRVDAAVALGTARPDFRQEILRFLRGLRDTKKPLARVQVLQAIGEFDAAEGALALRDVAVDNGTGPGVRLRAAVAMTKLHRNHKETAAAIAREVAHDKMVPWHIRVKAACAVANWSDLCRTEAQSLLVSLTKMAR